MSRITKLGLVERGTNESGEDVINSLSVTNITSFKSDKFEYMYSQYNSKLGLLTFIIITKNNNNKK